MKINYKLLITLLVSFLTFFNHTAKAGNLPGDVTITLADGYYRFAPKRNVSNIWMPNAAIAYNFDQHWAIEAGAGLVNSYLNIPAVTSRTKNHGFLYTADGIYRFNQCGRFEPYASFGVGMLGLRPNGTNPVYQGNINGGLGSQFFASDIIAFRAEARDLYTISGGKNDFMLNFGMSFLFGHESPCCKKPVSYKGEII